eukprot:753476-Hanusia_phi.AAC.6
MEPATCDGVKVLEANNNNRLRIFSIDGSHTAEATYNDMTIVTSASSARNADWVGRLLVCSCRTGS